MFNPRSGLFFCSRLRRSRYYGRCLILRNFLSKEMLLLIPKKSFQIVSVGHASFAFFSFFPNNCFNNAYLTFET